MAGKADTAILKPNTDRFTPEEIESMQRQAFKLLVDRAIDRHQRDSREEAQAVTVEDGVRGETNGRSA
jgi:hypothetical protein